MTLRSFMVLVTLLAFSAGGYAAENDSAEPATGIRLSQDSTFNLDTGKAIKGFRIGISKMLLKNKIIAKKKGSEKLEFEESIENEIGLSVGYGDISQDSLGFFVSLQYTELNKSVSSYRLDTNATYGLGENFYAFAGINLHKLEDGLADLRPGFGHQFGLSFQFNRQLGLNFAFVTINNEGVLDTRDVEFSANGVELSLNAYF